MRTTFAILVAAGLVAAQTPARSTSIIEYGHDSTTVEQVPVMATQGAPTPMDRLYHALEQRGRTEVAGGVATIIGSVAAAATVVTVGLNTRPGVAWCATLSVPSLIVGIAMVRSGRIALRAR